MTGVRTFVALLLALLFGAGAAQAQPSEKLVGNIEKTPLTEVGFNTSIDYAQGFTTGSHLIGYTLTSVDLKFKINIEGNTDEPDYTVSIWSADADGDPASALTDGTLMNPTTLSDGNKSHTTSGINLAADTKYFVVFQATDTGDRSPVNLFSGTDGKDADSATDWSIANAAHTKSSSGSTWTLAATGQSLLIAVHGHANPLVSNADQADGGNGSLNDLAQAFTTGSHAPGYTLTGVDLENATGERGRRRAGTVEIYSDSSSGCGTGITSCPLTTTTSLGTLTKTVRRPAQQPRDPPLHARRHRPGSRHEVLGGDRCRRSSE